MNKIKKMVKRTAALGIAFIMASAYVPNLGLLDLFANIMARANISHPLGGEDINFVAAFTRNLQPAPGVTPLLIGADANQNVANPGQVALEWNMPGLAAGTGGSVDRLRFPIEEGRIAVIEVLRYSQNRAFVTYEIEDADPNNARPNIYGNLRVNDAPFGAAAPRWTPSVALPLTGVWDPIVWEGGQNTFDILDYPAEPHIIVGGIRHNLEMTPLGLRVITPGFPEHGVEASPTAGIDWRVVTNEYWTAGRFVPNDDAIGHFVDTTSSHPRFGIEQGTGFSFSLQDLGEVVDVNAAHTVSFLWDGTTFRIVTGGFDLGMIADFEFTRTAWDYGPDTNHPLYPNAPDRPIWTFPNNSDWVHTVFTGFVIDAHAIAQHRPMPRSGIWGGPGDDPLFHNWFLYAATQTWYPPDPLTPANRFDGFTRRGFGWDLGQEYNILSQIYPSHSANNDLPPATNNLIVFTVHTPRHWYDGNFVQVEQDEIDDPNGPFSSFFHDAMLVFGLDGDPNNIGSNGNIQFDIRRVFAPNGTGAANDHPLIAGPDSARVEALPMAMDAVSRSFVIENVDAGLIFNESSVSIATPAPAANRYDEITLYPLHIALPTIYTFIEYDIIMVDGEFFIELSPYRGIPGRYELWYLDHGSVPYGLNPGNFHVLTTADYRGQESIHLPFEIGPGQFRHLWVRFQPSSFPGPLYSQITHFRATVDRFIFTAPGRFEIDPHNPHLTFLPGNLNLADFMTEGTWDIASVAAINAYFDMLNEYVGAADPSYPDWVDYVTFTFQIRSRLSPINANHPAVPVANVTVTIHRDTEPDGTPIRLWWNNPETEYDDIDLTLPPLPTPTPPPPGDFLMMPGSVEVDVMRAGAAGPPLMGVTWPGVDLNGDPIDGYVELWFDATVRGANLPAPDNILNPWITAHPGPGNLWNNLNWYVSVWNGSVDISGSVLNPNPPFGIHPITSTEQASVQLNIDALELLYDNGNGVTSINIVVEGEYTFSGVTVEDDFTFTLNLADIFEDLDLNLNPMPMPTPPPFVPPPPAQTFVLRAEPPTISIPGPPGLEIDGVYGNLLLINADVTPEGASTVVAEWSYEAFDASGNPIPLPAGVRMLEIMPGFSMTPAYLFVPNTVPVGTTIRVFARVSATLVSSIDITVIDPPIPVPDNSIPITGNATQDATMVTVGSRDALNPLINWASAELEFTASRTNTLPSRLFRFPEMYFLSVSLVEVTPGVGGVDVQFEPHIHESNLEPLTLDTPDTIDFPPPQNLRVSIDRDDDYPGRTDGFFDLGFTVSLGGEAPPSGIRGHRATSIHREQPSRTFFRIFVSENVGALENIADMMSIDSSNVNYRGNRLNSSNIRFLDGHNAFVMPGQTPTIDMSSVLDGANGLRYNGVIVIEVPLEAGVLDGPTTETLNKMFNFIGLDRNRSYFMIADSFIEFGPDDDVVHTDYSLTTSIVGITTMEHLAPPDPGAFMPPAPRDLIVEHEHTTLNSVTMSWYPVDPLSPEGTIRYEVVRMRSDQMPEDLLTARQHDIDHFINQLRERGLEAAIEVWGGNNDRPIFPPDMSDDDFSFIYDADGRARLVNSNLSPNTLYFYYVRSVWIVPSEGGGASRSYSTWVGVSATTSIVPPPVNLEVVLAPVINGIPWHEFMPTFDPRHQFAIRFDVPMDGIEGLWTDFSFQYSLMLDDGPWAEPIFLTGSMMLGSPQRREGENGVHYRFYFLISNLLPGQQYSIRVRMQDIINGDFSPYSNIAVTRTDTDQDAVDRDRDEENLHQYLRDLLADFMRRHYWIAQNTQNVFSALYRPSMINNLMDVSDSMIRLAVTGQDVNIYYLPQSLFLESWQRERGFIVQQGDMEISIPSHAVNMIDTDAVLEALQRIRDVPTAADYYVRLAVSIREFGTPLIHGIPAAGQEVIIGIEVVEANFTAANLDRAILDTLSARLANDYYTNPFLPEIRQMISAGASYEHMVRRLREVAVSIENQMSAYVNSRLLPTLDRVYNVNTVSQPFTVRIHNQPASASVNGFQFAGTNWVAQNITMQGTTRALTSTTPGSFAFNSQNLSLPGLNNMQGSETLTTLFVRYGLHDFLGTGNSFNLNANISLSAVQGIAARLAGAPAAANPQNWLRDRGYIVPVRGAASPASGQEAIYTIMALYEIRTGTRADAIRITNHGRTANMQGIDPRFRTGIQAAFELGIATDTNMDPRAPITVEEVLRMILAVNRRATL